MNRWKNYISIATGVAALTLICALTAKPLLAQIKAAFVENVDEPGRSPYSSTTTFNPAKCDLNAILCLAEFTAVPAGKRLIATNLTGRIDVQTPGVIFDFTLSVDNQVTVPTTLLAGVNRSGANMIGVNAPLLAFAGAGSTPSVFMESGTQTGSFRLTLSGYLVDCTASSTCAALVH
jgi:hypothetical protein